MIYSQLIFVICLCVALTFFIKNARRIYQNIQLGKPKKINDRPKERLKTMLLVAFGQKKMFKRIIPAVLHLFVYVGFCIINIEMLEIVLDGILGTHRIFSFMGSFYNFLIGSFEWLALFVLIACVLLLARRNILKLKRLNSKELNHWPKTDANIILFAEIILMSAFLIMNGADLKIQLLENVPGHLKGSFPISQYLSSLLPDNLATLITIERFTWWLHILGVFAFLNYLPYSKHLHILLAFPNTYFSKLDPPGKFTSMENVTNEVKAMLDPSFVPQEVAESGKFGVKDIQDLTWKNLLDAYTCTECGRCTSSCPANITGKLLSPRKIMMDTRDRVEEVSKNIRKNGVFKDDEKSLLDHYITREEIWACTTCNACVDQCPVNINPLEIILELRRYVVMEESKAPNSINNMFGNIENNGAPWKYSQMDRANWLNP